MDCPPHVAYDHGLDEVPSSVQTMGLLPSAAENAARLGMSCSPAAIIVVSFTSRQVAPTESGMEPAGSGATK